MRRLFPVLAVGALVIARCTCIDLSVPRAYPCDRDGGAEQCPEGWRCGLEGVCHARGTGAAYRCDLDTDCEADWRCGADGLCVDADEGLRPNAAAGEPTTAPLDELVHGVPTTAAVSNGFELPVLCDGGTGYAETISVAAGGEISKVVYYQSDGRHARPDGGFSPSCDEVDPKGGVMADFLRIPATNAVAVAETKNGTYWLADGGTLCHAPFGATGPGAPSCRHGVLGFDATQLRDGERELIAFSSSHYASINLADGGVAAPRQISASTGQPVTLHDLAPIEKPWASEAFLLAATNQGLYVTSRDGGTDGFYPGGMSAPWAPVGTPSMQGCEQEYPSPPVEIQYMPNADRLAIRTQHPTNEWSSELHVSGGEYIQTPPTWSCPFIPTPDWSSSSGPYFGDHQQSCSGCSSVVWSRHGSGATDYSTELLCDDGFRREVTWCGATYLSSETSLLATHLFSPGTVRSSSSSRRRAYASKHGGVWWDRSESSLTRSPITLDRVPIGVVGKADAMMAFGTPVRFTGNTTEDPLVEQQAFAFVPGTGFIGMRNAPDELDFLSAVQGEPTWALTRFDAMVNPAVVGLFPGLRLGGWFIAQVTDTDEFKPPYAAAAAKTPSGGQLVVVTSYDALLAADVTTTSRPTGTPSDVQMPGKPVLQVKLVPLSRTSITSVTLLPPHEGRTAVAEGFLIAGGRLFRFRAQSMLVWRSDELALPEGDVLEVWAHGPRGRIGFRDGRVLSLPNRTKLADALPSSAGLVRDYADMCGHPFALAENGLYRLVATSPHEPGTWTEVSLPSSSLVNGIGLSKSMLYTADNKLFVFLDTGDVLTVGNLGCIAP